jgi:hypothetical protein
MKSKKYTILITKEKSLYHLRCKELKLATYSPSFTDGFNELGIAIRFISKDCEYWRKV